MSINYFDKIRETKSFTLQACQKAFLNILKVTKSRVQRIANRQKARGGSRKLEKYEKKRKAAKQFIEQLKYSESRYCRGKDTRQHLPCGQTF